MPGAQRAPVADLQRKGAWPGSAPGSRQTASCPTTASDKALAALRRFRLLIDAMGVKQAAGRRDRRRPRRRATAPNSSARSSRSAFDCEVLSAEEEARLAGEGVLSAIPGADGIVGDLGGGSLELVEVGDGEAPARHLAAARRASGRASASRRAEGARDAPRAALKETGLREGRPRPALLHGRRIVARARPDRHDRDRLPAADHAPVSDEAGAGGELRRMAERSTATCAKALAAGPPRDRAGRGDAARSLVVEELEPSELVVSSLRHPRRAALFAAQAERTRQLDPLIEAARDAGGGEHRFGQHGDLLDDWIAPLFDDPPTLQRLRLASCLLADVAWQATPMFRADRGVEMALHGNWVGGRPGRPGDDGAGAVVQLRPRRLPDPRLDAVVPAGASCSARTAGAWRCASASGSAAASHRCSNGRA